MDLNLVRRGISFQILAIDCYFCQLVGFQEVKAVGQRHIGVAVVMAVRFAVRGYVGKPGRLAVIRYQPGKSPGKRFTICQKMSPSHIQGCRTVVEE